MISLFAITKKAQKYKRLPTLKQFRHSAHGRVLIRLSNLLMTNTMQISVRFFTILRELTDKREQILKFKNNETVTVDTILKQLSKQYGKEFVEYVYDHNTGEPKGFLQFLVNGRSISSEGLNKKLADGDVLAIIPPVGGG
jgi:MoaD family protein